jgi:hypothetical protein
MGKLLHFEDIKKLNEIVELYPQLIEVLDRLEPILFTMRHHRTCFLLWDTIVDRSLDLTIELDEAKIQIEENKKDV